MYDYYDWDTDVPDVEVDRIKEDFRTVFERNAIEVKLIRHYPQDSPEDADFFGSKTPPQSFSKKIKIFLNATQSKFYRRREHGIVTNDSTFAAFAEPETDIRNNDFIIFLRNTKIPEFNINRGQAFIVQNHNMPFYKGQFTWQEFGLRRVDHEDYMGRNRQRE